MANRERNQDLWLIRHRKNHVVMASQIRGRAKTRVWHVFAIDNPRLGEKMAPTFPRQALKLPRRFPGDGNN